MRTSARNHFEGEVVEVKHGTVNDEITLRTKDGLDIVAIITHGSATSLGLAQGKPAFALVKASSVIVMVDVTSSQVSARNCIAGKVTAVTKGAVNAEITIAGASGAQIAAIITNESAAAGFDDIFYAVPMAASKVERAAALRRSGTNISFLIDSLAGIEQCAAAAAAQDVILPFWIEIDVDHYRGGVELNDPQFMQIAQAINAHANLTLNGLMAHPGASYNISGVRAQALAEIHRQALLEGQRRLEGAGIACGRLSIGSTPAVLHAATLDGLTEARCGIFAFQDLFQAGIGACRIDDIALSVVSTVLSVNRNLNRVTIDAGGIALSKDRSTQGRPFDAGYGLVCDIDGVLIPDLHVQTVSQEVGLVTSLSGSPIPFAKLAEGSLIRILPNHADMTAAAHDRYHVVDGSSRVHAVWLRANGW